LVKAGLSEDVSLFPCSSRSANQSLSWSKARRFHWSYQNGASWEAVPADVCVHIRVILMSALGHGTERLPRWCLEARSVTLGVSVKMLVSSHEVHAHLQGGDGFPLCHLGCWEHPRDCHGLSKYVGLMWTPQVTLLGFLASPHSTEVQAWVRTSLKIGAKLLNSELREVRISWVWIVSLTK